MKLINSFGELDVKVKFSRYDANNATAILLVDSETGETNNYATTNVDLFEINMLMDCEDGDKYVVIKNYTENEGVEELLVKEGYLKPKPYALVETGHVQIPLYELSEKGFTEMREQIGKRIPKSKEQLHEEFLKMIDEL